MARQIHANLSKADTQKDTPSCEKLLEEALAERDRFLAQHPDYLAYQREIDGVLSKAGTSANRLAVLAVMMECKLDELNRQFHSLAGMLNVAFAQGYYNSS